MPSPSTPVLVDHRKDLWAAVKDGVITSVDLNPNFKFRLENEAHLRAPQEGLRVQVPTPSPDTPASAPRRRQRRFPTHNAQENVALQIMATELSVEEQCRARAEASLKELKEAEQQAADAALHSAIVRYKRAFGL